MNGSWMPLNVGILDLRYKEVSKTDTSGAGDTEGFIPHMPAVRPGLADWVQYWSHNNLFLHLASPRGQLGLSLWLLASGWKDISHGNCLPECTLERFRQQMPGVLWSSIPFSAPHLLYFIQQNMAGVNSIFQWGWIQTEEELMVPTQIQDNA